MGKFSKEELLAKKRVFVGNLDPSVDEEMLLDIFSIYGDIASVDVVRNKTTKDSKGFAFIMFRKYEDAHVAISKHQGMLIKGRPVKLDSGAQNKPKIMEMYKSYKGSFGGDRDHYYEAYSDRSRSRSPPPRSMPALYQKGGTRWDNGFNNANRMMAVGGGGDNNFGGGPGLNLNAILKKLATIIGNNANSFGPPQQQHQPNINFRPMGNSMYKKDSRFAPYPNYYNSANAAMVNKSNFKKNNLASRSNIMGFPNLNNVNNSLNNTPSALNPMTQLLMSMNAAGTAANNNINNGVNGNQMGSTYGNNVNGNGSGYLNNPLSNNPISLSNNGPSTSFNVGATNTGNLNNQNNASNSGNNTPFQMLQNMLTANQINPLNLTAPGLLSLLGSGNITSTSLQNSSQMLANNAAMATLLNNIITMLCASQVNQNSPDAQTTAFPSGRMLMAANQQRPLTGAALNVGNIVNDTGSLSQQSIAAVNPVGAIGPTTQSSLSNAASFLSAMKNKGGLPQHAIEPSLISNNPYGHNNLSMGGSSRNYEMSTHYSDAPAHQGYAGRSNDVSNIPHGNYDHSEDLSPRPKRNFGPLGNAVNEFASFKSGTSGYDGMNMNSNDINNDYQADLTSGYRGGSYRR